MLLIDPF
jgi:hypothetical protein